MYRSPPTPSDLVTGHALFCVDPISRKLLSPPLFRRKGLAVSEHFIESNQESVEQRCSFDDGFDCPMEKGIRFIPGANR
jgi:hypothetical protein